MRPAYIMLKFILKYTLWIYYPRMRIVNKPKKKFARTIFASNHAASFMDPLVIASNQPPIVFFMTRSDVFTPLLKPILWAAHMLPIYRSLDGEDTKAKNEKVFQKCYRILKYGRSLLIFSEGFTDDVFIRRLKPIKKGAVRIGFGACEALDWKKPIYVQTVGVNYSDPNYLGSDVVISNGEPICLNDYKSEYLKQPKKVINDLTKIVESDLQNQITDIRNKEWANMHEHIMRLTKKGMNAVDSDKHIPLLKRWQYSKKLADWINEQDCLSENQELLKLRGDLKYYFNELKALGFNEKQLQARANDNFSKLKERLFFILLFPVVLIGLFHNYLPYKLIKNFVEKSFKRPVFWGSVKMLLGGIAFGIYNLILILLFHFFIFENSIFWFFYFFIIPPISGLITYNYFRRFRNNKTMKEIYQSDLTDLMNRRTQLLDDIKELIPVA